MTTTQTTRTKETRMPTKTIPAPTAAEARALADQLEAQERDLTTRRRAARKVAEFDAAKAEFTHADTDLEPARVAAQERWAAATTADTLDIVELFEAFVATRCATRERAETIATANATANSIAPRYGQGGGQVDYRRDWHDVLTDTSFITALEGVIRGHVDSRGHAANAATTARIREAGTKAEESIK